MKRFTAWFGLVPLLGGLALVGGCATEGYWVSNGPVYPRRAWDYDYRYRNPDGLVVVYDSGPMLYTVLDFPGLYWSHGHYYRRYGQGWERSVHHGGPWAVHRHEPVRVNLGREPPPGPPVVGRGPMHPPQGGGYGSHRGPDRGPYQGPHQGPGRDWPRDGDRGWPPGDRSAGPPTGRPHDDDRHGRGPTGRPPESGGNPWVGSPTGGGSSPGPWGSDRMGGRGRRGGTDAGSYPGTAPATRPGAARPWTLGDGSSPGAPAGSSPGGRDLPWSSPPMPGGGAQGQRPHRGTPPGTGEPRPRGQRAEGAWGTPSPGPSAGAPGGRQGSPWQGGQDARPRRGADRAAPPPAAAPAESTPFPAPVRVTMPVGPPAPAAAPQGRQGQPGHQRGGRRQGAPGGGG